MDNKVDVNVVLGFLKPAISAFRFVYFNTFKIRDEDKMIDAILKIRDYKEVHDFLMNYEYIRDILNLVLDQLFTLSEYLESVNNKTEEE